MKELDVRKTVLVTGFEPFNGGAINPSSEIVKALAKFQFEEFALVTEILPCVYRTAGPQLINLIETHKPEVVIALGQAEGRSAITPEKIAINLDDAQIADNAGEKRQNIAIIDNGADGLFTTLPIDLIVSEISAAGIPATQSLTAGAFLCNHVFYSMQNHLLGLNVRSGFIHVPLISKQTKEFPGQPTMPLSEMVTAISIAIRVAVNNGN